MPKLRFQPVDPPFHIILVEPEIPPNTGNIARLCVGTGSVLHLCGPLGFSIEDSRVKRAGLDYWPFLKLHLHSNFDSFLNSFPNLSLVFFTSNTKRSYLEIDFKPGQGFVFGSETKGFKKEMLEPYKDELYAIPICEPLRNLNLANSVAIVLYEALKSIDAFKSIYIT
jgi:tRNA (cytidine/uridine-2'-O-)-methyltransferase